MDLKELRERGGFAPSAPVKHEVTWTRTADDGSADSVTFTVYVRKHSFGSIERLLTANGQDSKRSQAAAFISESILLGEDGSERLSYEDALQLDPHLARVLVEAVNEVNGNSAKN